MTRVLVAPDAFKGTFTAHEVCELIADGVTRAGDEVTRLPVADGGEGTLAILLAALGGEQMTTSVLDPLGRPLQAPWGLLKDRSVAIVETATASGLHLVTPTPQTAYAASTYGTGQLIAAAAAAGAKEILVGLGGSATSDGGIGAVEAITDSGGMHKAKLTLLCDVTTAYEDAAVVFGPQKGADAPTMRALSRRLARTARCLPRDPRGHAMTGAGGGLSGALWAAFDATLTRGAPRILDVVSFDAKAANADAVITGEGRLDLGSHRGKLVGEVARRCHLARLPVHAVVGSVDAKSVHDSAFASISVASTDEDLRAAWAAVR